MRHYKPMIWGDGSFGHKHIRERLASLVREFNDELAGELLNEPSDDMSEEDEALDILNANTSQDNGPVVWEFVDGDLMLSCLVSENSER
jgi:hypothetical protein